ncbi:hypothetical protein JCM3770_004702 [Rhodotorula araucariae]
MVDPRTRLALAGDSDDDTSPWKPAPSVAAHKVARFEGLQRKSKFELEREADAAREKAQRDEAARAYADFVDAFGGDDERGPSRGARPAVGGGGGVGRSAGKGFVRAGGEERYDPLKDMKARAPPPPPPAAPAPAPAPASVPPRAAAAQPLKQARPTAATLMADDDEPEAPKLSGPPGRKKRAGDSFLEQLKRDQAAREERLKQTAGRVGSSITALAAREHAPVLTGSYDVGDPLTTNLHVGGLPVNVTEQALGKLFAQFGPVGSVKIMWPRLDTGQLASTGGRKLGGFVAFLRRPDAERAAKQMDGAEWGDNVLKIGWGKAVPIPATALYEPDYDARSRGHRSRSRSLSPTTDPHEFLRAKAASGAKRPRSRSPPRTRAWPELEAGVEEPFLVAVAKKVRDNGSAFEVVLREKEAANARFAFLRDETLPSYHYFRMLVDPTYEPPVVASFDDEGKADIYSSDSSEDSEAERVGKGRLGALAQKRFESLLRGLTSSRDKIARGMAFALEHADCANYIADMLVASLTIDTTPVPRKLARLHLVSDVLHNSAASVPNAWVYRRLFEAKLPAVFDHLGDVYLSFPGRLKAEQFRAMIEKVIDVWANDWMLFEPAVIDDFKRRLAGLDLVSVPVPAGAPAPVPSAPPLPSTAPAPATAAADEDAPMADEPQPAHTHSHTHRDERAFKPSFKAAAFVPAEPEPASTPAPVPEREVDVEDVGGAPVGEHVDGTPVEEDVDGAPVADVDGAPIEVDVDGAPIEVDVDGAPITVDVDGASIEVDVDGAPIEADVDGAPIADTAGDDAPLVAKPTETVVLDDDDGEEMDMGSDDDIFQ